MVQQQVCFFLFLKNCIGRLVVLCAKDNGNVHFVSAQVQLLTEMQQHESILSSKRLDTIAQKGWALSKVAYPPTLGNDIEYIDFSTTAQTVGQVLQIKSHRRGLPIQQGDMVTMDVCQSQLLTKFSTTKSKSGIQRRLSSVTPVKDSAWVMRGHKVQIGAGCLPHHLEEVWY